jgi:hypothetical protein
MRKKLKPSERKAIKVFPRLARKFCTLVGTSKKQKPHEFLSEIASRLAELYSVAFLLPDVSRVTSKNRLSKKELAHRTKRYKILDEHLRTRLGAANKYWKVFDPPDEKSLVSTILSDDLADIYLDLEDGLASQRNGVSRDDILWQWRFDFRSHWGRHAVSALTTIHHLAAWDYE